MALEYCCTRLASWLSVARRTGSVTASRAAGDALLQHPGVQGEVVQTVLLFLTLLREYRGNIVPGHIVVGAGFYVIANGRAGCGYLNRCFLDGCDAPQYPAALTPATKSRLQIMSPYNFRLIVSRIGPIFPTLSRPLTASRLRKRPSSGLRPLLTSDCHYR